jgi:hypothetical protein
MSRLQSAGTMVGTAAAAGALNWLHALANASGENWASPKMLETALAAAAAGMAVNKTTDAWKSHKERRAATKNHHLRLVLSETVRTALERTRKELEPSVTATSPLFGAWDRLFRNARSSPELLVTLFPGADLGRLMQAANEFIEPATVWPGLEGSLAFWAILATEPRALHRTSNPPSLPLDLRDALREVLLENLRDSFAQLLSGDDHLHAERSHTRRSLHKLQADTETILSRLPAGTGGLSETWRIESTEPPRRLANGLDVMVCRLRNTRVGDRIERGKRYDLSLLEEVKRRDLRHCFSRHADTSARLRKHPNIAYTLTSFESGTNYWVIDEAVDGKTLEEILSKGPLAGNTLRPVMSGLARGLAALHGEGIVRRELTPANILVKESDWTPVLTDFELAKFTFGGPSVWSSGARNGNPYLAPEVSPTSGDATPASDVYGWGAIFLHALTGRIPEGKVLATDAIARSGLPKPVKEAVMASVQIARSRRPADGATLLSLISKWR